MGLKHIPAIDGLRAIAVLAVVAYHAGLGGSGYVGVDVFFVISGYLITRLLMEDGRLVEFYARRARRILPAAFLVVLVTLGLSFLLLPSAGDVARSAAAAGVFVANLFFQSATGGYWDASAESMPLLHLWSLSVEEQFYLFWPLLILFAKRWVGFVFAASLCVYAFLSWANPEAAFYQTYARAWELAAGGLVALRANNGGVEAFFKRGKVAAAPVPPSDVGLEVRQPVAQDVSKPTSIALRDFDAIQQRGIGFVINVATGLGLVHRRFRLTPEESDSNVETLNRHTEPRARLQVPAILRNIARAVLQHASRFGLPLILLACLVPLPVYVAQPLAVLGATLIVASVHRGVSTLASTLLESRPLVYVGLISYSLYLWHWPLLAIDRATRIGESPIGTRLVLVAIAFVLAALTYRYVETPFRRMRFRPGRTVFAGVACAALVAATGLTMAAKSPPKPVVVAKPLTCEGVPQKPSCYTTEPKVVVWGDSFATAWMPYVEHIANGLPVVLFFNTGCYPTAGEAVWRRSARETASCKAHNDKALAYLQRNGAEVLVLTSYYAELFREHPNHPGVANLVRALPNVKRIVVIGPTPELPAPSRDVTKGDFLAMSRDARDALSSLPVEVVDPTDYFCGEVCVFRRDGMELYSDRVHVTIAAVRDYVSQGEKPEGAE